MEQAIKDKAPKPPGLIPKNLQAFIIVGLALLMVIIMAVTEHQPPASPSRQTASSLPNLLPVNPQKVSDFQKDIEQAQRESAPQVEAALLQQQRQLASQATRPAQPSPTHPYGTPVTASDPSGTYPPGAYVATLPQGAENPSPSDPVQDEQKKRAYLSLFADNVALTYRKQLRSEVPSAATSSPASAPFPPAAADTIEMQDPLTQQAARQLMREGQQIAQLQMAVPAHSPLPLAPYTSPRPAVIPPTAEQAQTAPVQANSDGESRKSEVFTSPGNKRFLVFEGTVLEALLINRLDGTFAGPVSCILSNDVYSRDRQHLLIPAGSKIVGEASKVDTFGQARLAVGFHRLMMPDGYSVSLDQFKGLDQEGETALRDKVNNHYARIFGASLAIGVLGGVAQLGSGTVLNSDASDRIRQGFGVGMANAGEHILDRFLNILPTVTIREGTRIKIYLSNDLLLPDYRTHAIPTTL
ncbi:MAG TPA: TrbI/VirB10 family protein [Terriglobales bacterium]|nr:TrbI/VirB10 family protein [Terriglobales bacterium]